MLSSLLRPKKNGRGTLGHFSSSPPFAGQSTSAGGDQNIRHGTTDWTETENYEDTEEERTHEDGVAEEEADDEIAGRDVVENEDGDEETSLLPIFSAAHLDALPVYNITHAIRMIVFLRCETTLKWDQLRSPQVLQFLVKPMQQQIRTSHFSRATLYALMANCLQFLKEGQMNPVDAGSSQTRALVCELLAIKLLKEYNTLELIDALSYDFYPLQGLKIRGSSAAAGSFWEQSTSRPAAARTSTLEVAIRAQAKHFLAHPAVVRQLEAIYAGTIVFHSTADNIKRPQPVTRRSDTENRAYGSTAQRVSPDKVEPIDQRDNEATTSYSRRTVTLYDPRDASLFKLSRLRVPRYRQFLSTGSFAILLGLFLAVLSQRSLDITFLEVIFWFWSAGFMLDEIVGFTQEGFSLYILNFWNTFDLGILLLLIIYYCMRLYSMFLVGEGRRYWNNMAYDVLAANAVLLVPRLFSVPLDHNRYFSQLLIAFRIMSVDLLAVCILIIISCSGFFVAFALAFSNDDYDAGAVAYGLFQLVLGFTPAAWALWPTFNILGKSILTLFLFICHFLVITILISILTNSFMAIVTNANEEHQFVFAVNTISMVKNDALFSYVAPSNILAWFITPLRFLMTFRRFVKINRFVIKVTHFPLLFAIYVYERLILARSVYEPTDLIENRGRVRQRAISFMDPERVGLFSPSVRMRQESVSGFQKDRALDEVFRLAPKNSPRIAMKSQERRYTSNVVNNWIEQHEGIASSPAEQDRSIVERLERRRRASQKANLVRQNRVGSQLSGTRSLGSGPVERSSPRIGSRKDFAYAQSDRNLPVIAVDGGHVGTEDEGDDELVTNEDDNFTFEKSSRDDRSNIQEQDYFKFPLTERFRSSPLASGHNLNTPSKQSSPKSKSSRRPHNRNLSTNTILYNPVPAQNTKSSSSASPPKPQPMKHPHSGTGTPVGAKRSINATSKPRPIMPIRTQFQSAPSRGAMFDFDSHPNRQVRSHRRLSVDTGFDITSHLGLSDQVAVPASFGTEMAMAMATGMTKNAPGGMNDGSDRIMSRLVLAKMKTLEEGFQEVVREVKEMRTQGNSPAETGEDGGSRRRDRGKKPAGASRFKEREKEREKEKGSASSLSAAAGKGKGDTRAEGDGGVEKTSEERSMEAFLKKGGSL